MCHCDAPVYFTSVGGLAICRRPACDFEAFFPYPEARLLRLVFARGAKRSRRRRHRPGCALPVPDRTTSATRCSRASATALSSKESRISKTRRARNRRPQASGLALASSAFGSARDRGAALTDQGVRVLAAGQEGARGQSWGVIALPAEEAASQPAVRRVDPSLRAGSGCRRSTHPRLRPPRSRAVAPPLPVHQGPSHRAGRRGCWGGKRKRFTLAQPRLL